MFKTIRAHLNSLPVQIFALFWFTFTALLLLAFFIPSLDNRVYTELKGDTLVAYQKQIAYSIRNEQLSRLLVTPAPFAVDLTEPIHPILVDKNNNILGATGNEILAVQQFILQSNNASRPMVKNFGNIQLAGPFIIHINLQEKNSYLLYFSKKVDAQKAGLNFVFDHPIIIVTFIILFSTPFLWWLAWSIARPIRRLQKFAENIAIGDFTTHKDLEQQGAVELRKLGHNFNKMATALDDLLSTRESMLYAISHELRTPLTRLQLAAALIRRRIGEISEITRIDTETERLDKMINELLLLSRNQLKSQLMREVFPITEIWKDVIEDAKFEAKQQHINFNVTYKISSPEKYTINGNQASLACALENLLRNALKYTNDKMEATFAIENHYLIIDIDDNGPGIPEEEYSKIFTPFYRVDTARTRTTGGTGLGLAIVHNILLQHHGEVSACKSKLGGLKVTITLPL
ncbi:envelope stress sensor histidine kinase CpxA [Pasteurellaceae bacterium LIM206]|nr:envelope stress sensor histidine kinase CpxA [Pasteurellaceae bacterium LIM206]